MRRVWLFVLPAVFAVTIALPASASAAMTPVCIGDHPLCPSGVTHQTMSAAALQAAFDGADSGGGYEIFLGPGSLQICTPLSLSATHTRFRLVGAGVGQTRLTWCFPNQPILTAAMEEQNDYITGVSFVVVNTGLTGSNPHVSITNGSLRNSSIEITNQSGVSSRPALKLSGASLLDSTIISNDDAGVVVTGESTSSIERSEVRGASADDRMGVAIDSESPLTIRRLRSSFASLNVNARTGAYVQVSDSLIDLGSYLHLDIALAAAGDGTVGALLVAERVTIVGSGDSKIGAQVIGGGGPATTGISMIDSLIDLPGSGSNAAGCYRVTPIAPTQLNFERTAYDSTRVSLLNSPGYACTSYTPSDPYYLIDDKQIGFVDASGGDYHLRYDSPFRDAGAASVEAGVTDLGGSPRIVGPKGDLGAFEYQYSPPVPKIIAGGHSLLGIAYEYRASVTDADPGEAPLATFSWDFGDGANASGPNVSHAYAAGTHTLTLTATDPAGLTGSDTVKIVVPPNAKVTKKPKKAFRRGKKGFSISKSGAITIAFEGAAKAKLTLQSIGKKKKLKAIKGSQTLKLRGQKMKLTFGGRWNKKKLKAGKYRLSIQPIASDGTAGLKRTVDLKLK